MWLKKRWKMGPKWGEDQKMSDQPKEQESEGGGLRKSSEETQPRYLALRCPEQKICVCQSRNDGKFVKYEWRCFHRNWKG